MGKREELRRIAAEIARCRECRAGKSGLPVPGEGSEGARMLFVGMAPGREEAKTGRPFVGRSGRLLTQMLLDIGIRREEVYITSPVKYYPGKRALRREEIEHGATHLQRQADVLSPRLVVLLGAVAAAAMIPEEKVMVSASHGTAVERGGRIYFITFHPSAALRFKRIHALMREDMTRLKALKGRLGC